ncbi:MAG: heme exporter protein C [Glaciecola sp.]|jgi:heme exporter protein C
MYFCVNFFRRKTTVGKQWWKILCVLLLSFAVVQGFLGEVPRLNILNETIRNLYFHVGMWFAMITMMTVSVVYAIMNLNGGKLINDIKSTAFAHVGVLFGALGLLTGMLWGNYTWGSYWPDDPKIHGAAITVLIYFAYFILKSGVTDLEKRARISGAYNIFSYVLLVLFLIVYPRIAPSLHPGNGGNPGFNAYDLNSDLRQVFYPAILGWILLGVWIAQLKHRVSALKNRKLLKELNA